MARRAAVVALLAAAAQGAQVTEVQCIGRVAHKVTYDPEQAAEDAVVVVQPAEEHSAACRGEGLGANRGADRAICVGVNHDEHCASAKQPHLPLPKGASCENCFVGLASDLYYAVNITGLRLDHVGVGIRGSAIRAALEVKDDQAQAGDKRKVLAEFFEKPHVFDLKVLGRTLAEIKVSMPVTIAYEKETKSDEELQLGTMFDLELGENSVQYEHGQGWKHVHDKPRVTVHPAIQGDVAVEGHLTFTVTSGLRLEVTNMLWYQLNATAVLPLSFTSQGEAEKKDLKACTEADVDVDLRHEADVHINVATEHVNKHFGPKVDRHTAKAVVHKCVDVHPKNNAIVV